jgi:hypothetical protein
MSIFSGLDVSDRIYQEHTEHIIAATNLLTIRRVPTLSHRFCWMFRGLRAMIFIWAVMSSGRLPNAIRRQRTRFCLTGGC